MYSSSDKQEKLAQTGLHKRQRVKHKGVSLKELEHIQD